MGEAAVRQGDWLLAFVPLHAFRQPLVGLPSSCTATPLVFLNLVLLRGLPPPLLR